MTNQDGQGPAGLSKRRKHRFGQLVIEAPRSWRVVKPKFKFILLQLEVEPVVGDKEPAVLAGTLYGNVKGGYDQNLHRWLGRFTKGDRKYTIRKGKCADGTYYLVDIRGAYRRRGPVKPILEARKLGAMIQREDGLYFLEFVGYENTVSAEEGDFRRLFGAKPEEEVEVTKEDL